MKLGLITVSLNVMFKRDEVDYILRDSEPKVLIADEMFLPVIRQTGFSLTGGADGDVGLSVRVEVSDHHDFPIIPDGVRQHARSRLQS